MFEEFVTISPVTISVIVGALFTLIKWVYDRNVASEKSKRESIEHISNALKKGLSCMSKEEKLIAEEALSSHYKKNIYIDELESLLSAKSPKSAIDKYLRYRYYLKHENGKISYSRPPFKRVNLVFIRPNVPYALFAGVAAYLALSLFGLTIIQIANSEAMSVDQTKSLISQWRQILSIAMAYSGGTIMVILSIWALFRGIDCPSEKELKQALEGIFDTPKN